MLGDPKQPCVYLLANERNGTLYAGVTSHIASVLIGNSADPPLLLVIPAKAGIHGGVDPGLRLAKAGMTIKVVRKNGAGRGSSN